MVNELGLKLFKISNKPYEKITLNRAEREGIFLRQRINRQSLFRGPKHASINAN